MSKTCTVPGCNRSFRKWLNEGRKESKPYVYRVKVILFLLYIIGYTFMLIYINYIKFKIRNHTIIELNIVVVKKLIDYKGYIFTSS
jgi:hypothetical protein